MKASTLFDLEEGLRDVVHDLERELETREQLDRLALYALADRLCDLVGEVRVERCRAEARELFSDTVSLDSYVPRPRWGPLLWAMPS